MPQKLEVTLPDEIIDELRARVEAGDYLSSDEIVHVALAAWLDEPELRQAEENAFKARIARSLNDPRDSIPADEAWAEIDAHVRAEEAGFVR